MASRARRRLRAGGAILLVAVVAAGCATTGAPTASRAVVSPTGDGTHAAAGREARGKGVPNPFGLSHRDRVGVLARSFDEAMALPDDQLDVGRAALLLGQEDDPGIDLAACMVELDTLAADTRDFIDRNPGTPRPVAFATYLFARHRADRDDPQGHDPDNLHLHRVLARGRGYCASLCVLALAVGERIDVDVAVMRAPFHTYLQVEGTLVETTREGQSLPASHYAALAGVSAGSPAYLAPIGRRQVLADVLSNRGALAYRAGDVPRALASLDRAIALDPRLPFAWHNRAVVRAAAGDREGALADLDHALALDPAAPYSLAKRAELLRAR